jgi:hypothetical protein
VNPGGEPGRDDSGLPPVDIEIPDDARELDRDVLAYRRELRAQRRRARFNRLLGPLRGHGAILPLIASCVALSMLAGALLSVFTISPASAPVVASSAVPAPGAPGSVPSAGGARDGGLLPQGTVLVNGKATPLRGLVSAVLALVPRRCDCDTALRQLTAQAAHAGAKVFFVGTNAVMVDVTRLARTDGRGTAVAVNDTGDVLRTAYQPAGLTIVLVRADASTTVQRNLTPGFRLGAELRALSSPGPGAAQRPLAPATPGIT